jgi:hypothetical protein
MMHCPDNGERTSGGLPGRPRRALRFSNPGTRVSWNRGPSQATVTETQKTLPWQCVPNTQVLPPESTAQPKTNSPTLVSTGLFTETMDFGSGVFTGAPRWLEIWVRTNGSADFVALRPRQELTPTPYAITAANAVSAAGVSGPVPASQLTGAVPDAQLSANVARLDASQTFAWVDTLANGSNSFSGKFSGDGSGLTALNASTLVTGTLPVGQHEAAGAMTGGNFLLTGGFWSLAEAVQATNAPVLSVSLAGNAVVLFWPSGATSFVLEHNNDLANTNGWSQAEPVPASVGGFNHVTNAIISGSIFYRLRSP